jgi:LDH2 family malate/lactate/ureidoglycolate dehydrogenase
LPACVPHFFIAIDPRALMDSADYLARIDTLLKQTRTAPAADPAQPVRLPGERRRQVARQRAAWGIPMPAKVIEELLAAADRYAPVARGMI